MLNASLLRRIGELRIRRLTLAIEMQSLKLASRLYTTFSILDPRITAAFTTITVLFGSRATEIFAGSDIAQKSHNA